VEPDTPGRACRAGEEDGGVAAALDWSVDDDPVRSLVTVRGALDRVGAARLRVALLKELAKQPRGLLVDISAMTVDDPLSLTVFTAVQRQASLWPGMPVLLCTPGGNTATTLRKYRRLAVLPSIAAGLAALASASAGLVSLSEELLPVAGAARDARNLATEACARWDQPDLVWPASLVVSELVTNAVRHAGTMITVQFLLRERYLHIGVRDGSSVVPQFRTPDASGGRGLILVQTLAVHWGSLPTDAGKVVWATLATQQ